MSKTTSTSGNKGDSGPLYRIPPYYYIHVLDQNTNITRLEVGPKTFIKQDNETVTIGPEKMIIVPYVFIFCKKNRTKKISEYFNISGQDTIVLLNHRLYVMQMERSNLIRMDNPN